MKSGTYGVKENDGSHGLAGFTAVKVDKKNVNLVGFKGLYGGLSQLIEPSMAKIGCVA